jgi:hypothetical protein
MPVTFRAPEPVRFDVDPPDEDARPLLGYAPGEIDEEWLDQLLNKGKRGVNWLADQLLGRTAEEEFETAMVEFANPLISLVPRKTQKQLIDLFRSRAGSEPGAKASYYTRRVRNPAPPGSLLERWYEKNPDQAWSERRYPRDDDQIIPVPEDTALHNAARWVSERYPRMMSHVADATVDPRLAGHRKHGGEVAGQIGEMFRGGNLGSIPFMIRDRMRRQNYTGDLGRRAKLLQDDRRPPFHIGINPMFAGRSSRLDPDNPLLTETAEAIDILTHELTHGGQMLRHGSRQQDVLAREDWAKDYVPFKAVPEGTSYWRSPAERSAHTSGLANQLHYLMDERRWADPGVVSVIDEAITGVIERRIPNTPGIGAYAITSLTEAASEGPAALRREIQRIARDATDQNMMRGFESEQFEALPQNVIDDWVNERNVGDVFEP